MGSTIIGDTDKGAEYGKAALRGPKVAEGAPAKARRYLTEGRLSVLRVDRKIIQAQCRGDGQTYACGWYTGRWRCSCEARTDQCAHLRALRLVVDRPTR